jgi:hypothetical protein
MENFKLQQFDPGKFLKAYWPYLAGGVVLILLVSYGLFRFALSGHKSAEANTNAGTTTSTSTSTDLVGRKLDGVLVKPEDAALPAWAVMVEMHPDARPLSGISKASLVFEAPVEGGITRLMAVFDATTTLPSVGPVRSARPYFVEWADALNAVYAHVGGSPDALNRIAGLMNFRNLDEMANSKYFWRSKDRYAPHNVYTDRQYLLLANQNKGWQPSPITSWNYNDSTSTTKGEYTNVKLPYGGSYTAEWRYDAEQDIYTRYQGNKKFADADGSVVQAKNILVIVTEQRVLDDYGRLYIRTTGSGQAILYRNGFKQDVRWSRTPGENIRIETTDGRGVPMARGTTWIEVVTQVNQMPVAQAVSSTAATER